MRAGLGAALVLTLPLVGCARLAEAIAPPAAPVHPVSELKEVSDRGGALPLRYADDGVLHPRSGDAVLGREAIRRYLTAPPSAEPGRFEFFTDAVFRCGENHGVEVGSYRAQVGEGVPTLTGGVWTARWEKSAEGGWQIRETWLLEVGAELPARVGPACTGVHAEVAAAARFTAALQGVPFGFLITPLNGDIETAGTLPFLSRSNASPGLAVSAFYRFGDWVAVGGTWSRDPKLRTVYGYPAGPKDWLYSEASFTALTAGYRGRNVQVDVGPAWVRSHWQWGDDRPPAENESRSERLGAVVSARVLVPLKADLGIEVLLQQRFFGREGVPRTSQELQASRSGLFVGLGLALLRTPF